MNSELSNSFLKKRSVREKATISFAQSPSVQRLTPNISFKNIKINAEDSVGQGRLSGGGFLSPAASKKTFGALRNASDMGRTSGQ